MIDGRTGDTIEFEEVPLFSPDSMRFAENSPSWMDCELGSGATLTVWRLTNGLPVQEFELRSWDCGAKSGWAADSLRWRSPDTLSFIRHDISDSGHVRGLTRPQFLVKSDSTWRLVLPHGAPKER